MFAEMVRALMSGDEAKTETRQEPAIPPAAIVPDCPVCGASPPYLYESQAICCRRYLRTWDRCNTA
jgi:hypothetical protein